MWSDTQCITFPWWLMLSILTCAFWSFVWLLWRNVFSPEKKKVKVPCPRINWLICFCHWVVGVLYIIYMLIPDQIYDLQIFSPILWVVFSLSWQCPVMYKTFLTLTKSNLFLIVLSLLLVPQPRNCCQIQRHDHPWCFLPRVAVSSSHASELAPRTVQRSHTRRKLTGHVTAAAALIHAEPLVARRVGPVGPEPFRLDPCRLWQLLCCPIERGAPAPQIQNQLFLQNSPVPFSMNPV